MSGGSNWIVRPVERKDTYALLALAMDLGAGMTTFPADREVLEAKVESSIQSFAGSPESASQYLLVLEDIETAQVEGVAGVYPRIGMPHGFFSYKVTRLFQQSDRLARRNAVEMLVLSNDLTDATEVGTLAVSSRLRGTSAGRLLARSRYMLMASFPDRFADCVMAEMRGWQDESGSSPFWNALGAKFFDMPFEDADRLSSVDVGFIADLMPRMPIYTALLPHDARAAIGRAHKVSARAMSMLIDEGFRYEGFVDVFDSGPQVQCNRSQIRTVQLCRETTVQTKVPQNPSPWLVSVGGMSDFRVAEVDAEVTDRTINLSASACRMLVCAVGDNVLAAPGGKRAGHLGTSARPVANAPREVETHTPIRQGQTSN